MFDLAPEVCSRELVEDNVSYSVKSGPDSDYIKICFNFKGILQEIRYNGSEAINGTLMVQDRTYMQISVNRSSLFSHCSRGPIFIKS